MINIFNFDIIPDELESDVIRVLIEADFPDPSAPTKSMFAY